MNTLSNRPEPRIASVQLREEKKRETAFEKYTRQQETIAANIEKSRQREKGIDPARPYWERGGLPLTKPIFDEILGKNWISKAVASGDIERLRKMQSRWDELNAFMVIRQRACTARQRVESVIDVRP